MLASYFMLWVCETSDQRTQHRSNQWGEVSQACPCLELEVNGELMGRKEGWRETDFGTRPS